MAYYKYIEDLIQQDGEDYDVVFDPGMKVRYSGIYQCQGCKKSAVSTEGSIFPSTFHHSHQPGEGEIRWRLIVRAQLDRPASEPRRPMEVHG